MLLEELVTKKRRIEQDITVNHLIIHVISQVQGLLNRKIIPKVKINEVEEPFYN